MKFNIVMSGQFLHSWVVYLLISALFHCQKMWATVSLGSVCLHPFSFLCIHFLFLHPLLNTKNNKTLHLVNVNLVLEFRGRVANLTLMSQIIQLG